MTVNTIDATLSGVGTFYEVGYDARDGLYCTLVSSGGVHRLQVFAHANFADALRFALDAATTELADETGIAHSAARDLVEQSIELVTA